MKFQSSLSSICILITLFFIGSARESILRSPESQRVEALQKSIMETVEMNYQNYKFYPFAIKETQDFVIDTDIEEQVKSVITVHWIDKQNNAVKFPTFMQSQRIRVRVIDQNDEKKIIKQRNFHFQTGFKFTSEPNHRYRIIFYNFGQQLKMTQFSISYTQSSTTKVSQNNQTKSAIFESANKIKQIHKQFEEVSKLQNKKAIDEINLKQKIQQNVTKYSQWAIWQVTLFVVFVFLQIWMIGREINHFSIL